MQTAQLVVIKLYIALWHPANLNFLTSIEGEHLIKFWTVNEFQLDSTIFIAVGTCPLVVQIAINRVSSVIDSLEEINGKVRGAKWNDEAILEV